MSDEDKKEKIKDLLRNIHEGEGDVEKMRSEFKDLLNSISPQEIPSLEQELVKEGVTPDEIAEMCDLHLDIFRDSVENEYDLVNMSKGHPLNTLYRENEEITRDAEMLPLTVRSIQEEDDPENRDEKLNELKKKVSDLLKIDRTHYTRQEMIIFPHIEKRGIEAVPRVLWRKHDENMGEVKKLLELISKGPGKGEEFFEELEETSREVSRSILDMVFRENNILYPTLKELLSEEEWAAVLEQERDLGYYKIEPEKGWDPDVEPKYPYQVEKEISETELSELPDQLKDVVGEEGFEKDTYDVRKDGDLEVDTGFLDKEEINSILRTLPVDITFIDENNRVRYYSETERIFPRSRSIIGRPVKFCHPPGSVDKVKKILEKFRSGEEDEAEFWIQGGDAFIHIRYFPVRNDDGDYLGAIEMVQEVSDIRGLEGQKRILDWGED
ncbi:MAG: DUF438 domain-containing protein [Thermoplasmata archaeon]